MCTRYICIQNIEKIERRFNLNETPEEVSYVPSYNIQPGQYAPVIASNNPQQLQMFRWAYTPSWSKKLSEIINIRTEGDANKENSPSYTGKNIITATNFRKQIRSQRCLVIADGYYEGPKLERLEKPYMVYLQNKVRPFAMAGLWDAWRDENGEEIFTFGIITVVANELIRAIGYDRMPVILSSYQEKRWLNPKAHLNEITPLLASFDSNRMNAYPVSDEINKTSEDGRFLVEPAGQRIYPEYFLEQKVEMGIQGFGRRSSEHGDPDSWADWYRKVEKGGKRYK